MCKTGFFSEAACFLTVTFTSVNAETELSCMIRTGKWTEHQSLNFHTKEWRLEQHTVGLHVFKEKERFHLKKSLSYAWQIHNQ